MTDPIAARGAQPGTIGEGHHDGRGFIHGTGCDRVVHYAQGCPEHMGEYGDWQLNPSAVRETQPGTGDTVSATKAGVIVGVDWERQPGTEDWVDECVHPDLPPLTTPTAIAVDAHFPEEGFHKSFLAIEAEAHRQGRETLDVERLAEAMCAVSVGHYRGWDAADSHATVTPRHREDAEDIARILRALAVDPRPETEGTE